MTNERPLWSRRSLMGAAAATTAAGVLAGRVDGFAGAARPRLRSAGNFPQTPEWNFVFVNHVTTNPFFTPTQYGIDDASALLGTTSQWTGSDHADTAEMVNAFQAAIAGGADGIAVALVDLEAFNDPVQEALDAGIPVVSYNADAPNARLGYVGQDLFGSGVEMGKRIVELVGEGSVGLFIATLGTLNIQPRVDGAIQAIKDSGANIEYEVVETSAQLPEELNRIEAWYLGHTDAVGMFAVDAGSTQGVGQVVQSHDARSNGLKGAGGYDLLPMTVQLVADGVLDFTIDQQPYLQGFLPVQYLYLTKLSGGVVLPPATNTGLVFLNADTAALFLNTASRFEGDSDEQQIVEAVAATPGSGSEAPATSA